MARGLAARQPCAVVCHLQLPCPALQRLHGVQADHERRGVRMLQHIAHGFLDDGGYLPRHLASWQGQFIVWRNLPVQRDAAPVQRRLDAVAQPREPVRQGIVLAVHRIHQQAQVQQAQLQRLHQRPVFGVPLVHQGDGVDELGPHLVVQVACNAFALALHVRAGPDAAPWAPLQCARQLHDQQDAQHYQGPQAQQLPAQLRLQTQLLRRDQQQGLDGHGKQPDSNAGDCKGRRTGAKHGNLPHPCGRCDGRLCAQAALLSEQPAQ